MTKLGPGSMAGQYRIKPSIWWDSDNNSYFYFTKIDKAEPGWRWAEWEQPANDGSGMAF